MKSRCAGLRTLVTLNFLAIVSIAIRCLIKCLVLACYNVYLFSSIGSLSEIESTAIPPSYLTLVKLNWAGIAMSDRDSAYVLWR